MIKKKKRCGVNIGGLLRCCIEAVPVDDDGYAVEGDFEGQLIRCPYHGEENDGGVRFVLGRWEAAWIGEKDSNSK